MRQSEFRVIIVGGGPVGLFAAHLLAATGIKYIVLEKSPTIERNAGACYTLQACTLRVLQQLNLLEKVEALSVPMMAKEDRLWDGKVCRHTETDIAVYKKSHGYPCQMLNRRDFVDLLYQNLPNHEHTVRTNAKVVDIKVQPNGVKVILEDGSIEEGSIVLGCDGTYSRTMKVVQNLSRQTGKSNKGLIPVRHYRTLYGRLPNPAQNGCPYPGGDSGVIYEIRAKDVGTQTLVTPKVIVFTLVKRIAEPQMEYIRHTDEEAQEFAKEFLDAKIFGDTPFSELWSKAEWYTLIDQETGFSDLWFHERIVMAGDSIVTMESLAGMGLNVGIQQVVALVNLLNDKVRSEAEPSTETLIECFEKYRVTCEKASRAAVELTTKSAEFVTWPSTLSWVLDQYVFPLIGYGRIMQQVFCKDIISYGQLVRALPKEDMKSGSVPWRYDV